MLALKIMLYVLTLAGAFFFAFRERKLTQQLTDEALEKQQENVSDFDSFYGIRRDIRRVRILRNLPREARSRLNVAIGLKVLFAVVFVIEVITLQR